MPSLGADMEHGTLTEWLVKPGDHVHRGDIVAVVETDKGAIEVEIFEDAVIGELLVMPVTDVPVGTPLARLEPAAAGAVTPTAPATPAKVTAPVAPPEAPPEAPAAPATPARPGVSERRKISPAARKHAREHRLDLGSVVGTGHGGVVTLADVERAVAGQPETAAAPSVTAAAEQAAAPKATAPTTGMRRAIAAAMSRSKREIPHYYLAHTLDMERALRWLERRNAERSLDDRVLYGALLVKAVACAMVDNPSLNGHWQDDRFVPSEQVNVGVAISLRGGGLVAPALPDAANTDLDSLMAALRDVTRRARGGRLKGSEVTTATVTISSLGEGGVEAVFPIIHPPQVAIVGFGGVVARPWVVDGGLHVRRVITASLAADHRVSDGHVGARFLGALERRLSEPETL